jgi:dihydrofolate reductase
LSRVSIIVARSRNGVIGRDNALPWHLPEELKHFRATTLGHPVVMGRSTFESIGRPLPGRRNIVVTGNARWSRPGCERAATLQQALALCAAAAEVFVIGGGRLYAEAIGLADRLVVTELELDVDGDVRFPEIDAAQWREVARRPGLSATGIAYAIVEYERVRENRYNPAGSC